MPPYHHPYPIPQTPCSGPSLLPQKYGGEKEDPPPLSQYGKNQIHIQEPFDESDIELQVGHGHIISLSWKEWSLRVLRYCTIILLGLVLIEVFARIECDFFQTRLQERQSSMTHLTSEDRAPPGWHPGPPDAKETESRLTFTITYPPNDDSTDSSKGHCSDPYCLDRIQNHDTSEGSDKSEMLTGTNPTPCIGSSCALDPPSIPHDDGRTFTTVIVKESGPGVTSPPICVPPHCSPHPPPGHHYHNSKVHDDNPGSSGYVDVQSTGSTFHIPTRSVGGTYTQDGPPRVTATSPPICVPPHCYPHPPPDHHHSGSSGYDYIQSTSHIQSESAGELYIQDGPPRVTATSPPICVPPHCHPHPPPHHHRPGSSGHDDIQLTSHIQSESAGETSTIQDGPPRVTATSPPICVPPQCHPHPPPGHHDDYHHHHDEDISVPNHYETPSICVPPRCFPRSQSDGERDHVEADQHGNHNYDEADTDYQDQKLPHGCVPPYCFPTPYPHPPMWSEQDQDQDQTPPICVPPHCHQHHVDIDRATEVIGDNLAYPALVVEKPDMLEVDNTPRGSTSLIEEDIYINDHDEKSEFEDEDEDDWDDDKPICMPPICVPPARSRPICVPPICVPPDDFDGDGTYQERRD